MPLERKPAAPDGDPGYPSSDEYNADRRTFLWFVGAAATGAVGYLSYKAFAEPQIMPAGAPPPIKSANPSTPPYYSGPVNSALVPQPAQPQVAPPGETTAVTLPPAQPQVAAPGKMAVEVQPQPPVAQPQAQIRGDTAVVQPVQPQAAMPGGVTPPPKQPAQPQSQAEGGVKAPPLPPAPKAPAVPQAQPLGDAKAVDPAQPKVNVKGGAGLKRVKRNQQSA